MAESFKRQLLAAFCLLLITSCVSDPGKDRAPAQAKAEPAITENSALPLDQQTETLIKNLVSDFDQNKTPIEVLIRSTIALHAISQKLSASFDLRLNYLIKHPKPDFIQSDLDCQIWDNYYFAFQSEETLLALQERILLTQRTDLYNWFTEFFFASRGDTLAQILTKAQLTRALLYHHQEICQTQKCPDFITVTDPLKRPFDPLDDQAMLNFKNRNLSKIALITDFRQEKPGQCFKGSDRQPDSEAVFDWKSHHTWGSSLPNGKFVVTYDDGPSGIYTPQLTQMWEESGYTKPSFFWLKSSLVRNINLAKSIRARGYTIGSHTESHPDIGNIAKASSFTELSGVNRKLFSRSLSAPGLNWATWKDATLNAEIVQATEWIYKTLDLDSTVSNPGEHLFRLPYGSGVKNPIVGSYFAKINIRHYFWTIDSLDWQDKNPLSILQRIQKEMRISKRGIILIHDIHPQSVAASKLLIQMVKENKSPVPVEFVSLPQKW